MAHSNAEGASPAAHGGSSAPHNRQEPVAARAIAPIVLTHVVSLVVLVLLAVLVWWRGAGAQVGASMNIVVLVLVAFVGVLPTRAPVLDRLVSVVGAVELAFLGYRDLLGAMRGANAVDGVNEHGNVDTAALLEALHNWALGLFALWCLLVVVGFLSQMVRRERSHMVASLSSSLLSGAAMASASGWLFTPVLLRGLRARDGMGISGMHLAVLALVALVVLVLMALPYWWYRNAGASGLVLSWGVPQEAVGAHESGEYSNGACGNGTYGKSAGDSVERNGAKPSGAGAMVGIALLPVMFSGLVVFLGALMMLLV